MAMSAVQPTFVTPLVPLQSARSRTALRGVVQLPAEVVSAGSSTEMPQNSALGSAAVLLLQLWAWQRLGVPQPAGEMQ